MTFTSGTDTTLQRYVESMLENGSYIDNPESLSDFQNRGRYYFFNLPKQDTRETNLVINTTFTANNFGNNVNVCVAEFFKTIARVEIDKTGKAKLTNMQNE
jgi:hypothetical protein